MHTFVHPGTFMSPEMTFSLQHTVASSVVRKRALEKLRNSVPFNYQPKALETVHIGFHGVGKGHDECTKDGETAIGSALLLWATGDTRYGALSLSILNSWASKNKVFAGDNATLEAAWSVCSLARAAELLKYSKDANTANGWKASEPIFYMWIDRVIYPVLKSKHIWSWKVKNNWHYSVLCARMQLAILREDQEEWKWCIETYKKIFPCSLVSNGCCGETVETRRDVTHNMFLLGGMVQVAEMAYHQKIDIYDARLVDCFETQAKIMLKETPEGLTRADIKTPYGYWIEPVFEIPYAHFRGRLKKPMPYTERLLSTNRPDRITFHWGGNTLTHA